MAQFEIRRATRAKVKGRLGWCGASGSGKTPSALLFSFGMTGEWEKVGMIDTEGGRGELYAGDHVGQTDIGQYQYIRFDPPFDPNRYIAAIGMMEQTVGPDGVIIIDSLSHAWEGSGGMIEQKDKLAASSSDNDFTAWRKITPMHNALVDKILRCQCHIICNIRAKTEYSLEKDERGKTHPVKIGMKPIFREGLDYEMTLYFDINAEHISNASKDNSHIFDQNPVLITPNHGQQFLAWLNAGEARPEPPVPAPTAAQPSQVRQSAAGSNGGNGGNRHAIATRTPAMDDAWNEIKALAKMLNPDGTPHFTKNSWASWWQEAYDVDSPAKLSPSEWPRARDFLLDEQALLHRPAEVDPMDSISDPFADDEGLPGEGDSPSVGAASSERALSMGTVPDEDLEDVAGAQIERIGELVAACGLSKEDGNWTGDMFRVLAHLGLKRKKLLEYSIEERKTIIDNLAGISSDPAAREALLASRSEKKEPEPAGVDGPGF